MPESLAIQVSAIAPHALITPLCDPFGYLSTAKQNLGLFSPGLGWVPAFVGAGSGASSLQAGGCRQGLGRAGLYVLPSSHCPALPGSSQLWCRLTDGAVGSSAATVLLAVKHDEASHEPWAPSLSFVAAKGFHLINFFN